MSKNVSLYRPFCFTDSWICEKQQTLWGFSMGKCSWILVIAQVSFHQQHTEFRCMAKVNDFLLEMQIKKLAQKKPSCLSLDNHFSQNHSLQAFHPLLSSFPIFFSNIDSILIKSSQSLKTIHVDSFFMPLSINIHF